MELEQQFKIQQRLDLEEQNRLALEELTRVGFEIQKQLELEEQNKITASVTIQQWYHDISYRCLELEHELLLLEKLEIHRLDNSKYFEEDEHYAKLEPQQRLELEHECFLLDQKYSGEQVSYFQHDYFLTQNDVLNQPP